jgi:hypothetical protein
MPSFFSRSRSDSHLKLGSRKASLKKLNKAALLRFNLDTVSTCTDAESSTAPSSFASQVDNSHYMCPKIRPAQGQLTESDKGGISQPIKCQGGEHNSDLSSLTSNTLSFSGKAATVMQDAMTLKKVSSSKIKPRQTFHRSTIKWESVNDTDWGYFVDVIEDLRDDQHSQLQDHSNMSHFELNNPSFFSEERKSHNCNTSVLILTLEKDEKTSLHGGLGVNNSHLSLSLEASLARFYGI